MMKSTKIFIGFAIAALFLGKLPMALAAGEQTATGADLCSYYDRYESVRGCGSEGYPMAYGKKYCERFSKVRSSFSAFGQKWVDGTLTCLQERLEQTKWDESVKCKDLPRITNHHHAECYSLNGFCQLSSGDLMKTIKVVSPEVVSLNFVLGYWEMGFKCEEDFQRRLASLDPALRRELEDRVAEGIFDRHYLEQIYLSRLAEKP